MKEQSNKEDITQEKEITANNDTQIAEKGKSNATPKRYGDDKGGDTGQGGGESGTQPKDEKSYIEVIYDEIVKVIGGDNPSQYFMMTFPAQVINPKDYEYDIENNAPKGPVVEANESRLANKLFDPCHITGADNGMMLSNQYKSALDVLTPRLDKKTAISKEKLRSLLLTKYPYDFGDGLTNNQTLQSVYFKLYDEYVEANRKWAELQDNEKSRIRQKYRSGSEEDNKKAKDEYLSWYETVAQSELTALNEKYSKVLSVFAPTDMDILEGVLDSGVGSELENAKRVMRNFAKQSPNGGDIYPVNFTPSNWFEYLANGKIFVTDFIAFQYFKTKENYLNENNNAHLGVIKSLIKNKIDYTRYLSPSSGAMDMVCNKDMEKCFKIYEAAAKKILPLNFERRSRAVLEELGEYLKETNYDFEYFKNLCQKADELGVIVNSKIDFRTMIRNHIGIMNGKYQKKDRIKRAIERARLKDGQT